MNMRFLGLLLLVITGLFFTVPSAFGDDPIASTPSLEAVHKLLQQAGGYQAATPPPIPQQTELLHQALKMISDITHAPQVAAPPRGYLRQLNAATRAINAALAELASGDTAHKTKGDIFDADDFIKSLM